MAFVPGAGIEPARAFAHRFLRPARLPVPPPGLVGCGCASEVCSFIIVCRKNGVLIKERKDNRNFDLFPDYLTFAAPKTEKILLNITKMQDLVSIFGCRATSELAGKIADSYGCKLGKSTVFPFSDGEFQPAFEENIRGRHVFIIQSTFPPADNLLELMMMVDAARRASAKNIVAVIPYFGLARQDRKDRPRVSIASKLVATLLTASGVQRIVTLDLHADQIQGFFDVPVDHLYASSIMNNELIDSKFWILLITSAKSSAVDRTVILLLCCDRGMVSVTTTSEKGEFSIFS